MYNITNEDNVVMYGANFRQNLNNTLLYKLYYLNILNVCFMLR